MKIMHANNVVNTKKRYDEQTSVVDFRLLLLLNSVLRSVQIIISIAFSWKTSNSNLKCLLRPHTVFLIEFSRTAWESWFHFVFEQFHMLYMCAQWEEQSRAEHKYAVHTVGACAALLFNMKVTWCRCMFVYIMIITSACQLLSVSLILITFALPQNKDWFGCDRMNACVLCVRCVSVQSTLPNEWHGDNEW